MAEAKDLTNRVVAKIFSAESIALAVTGLLTISAAYWALANGQESNKDKINDNTKEIHQIKAQVQQGTEEVKQEINQLQIQTATMQNEQKNQSKDIERILKILERNQ